MLTEKQKACIVTIPENKKVNVRPFNPKGLVVAEEIMSQIKSNEPGLKAELLGSLALGIAGVEDVDIYLLCEKQKYGQHVESLQKVLGEPNKFTENAVKWEIEKDGFHVDIALMDPENGFAKRVMTVFGQLKNNLELLKEYEQLKLSFHGKSYREYQTAKFEFFNRVLEKQEKK